MKTITIEQFGQDHWSTFAYIETLCVDHDGKPDWDRMRINEKRHPAMRGRIKHRITSDATKWHDSYSTRLKGHTDKRHNQAKDHDDFDCAEDLEHAGLIEILGTGINPFFKMTPQGHALASLLRIHKANGGSFHTFVPSGFKDEALA